MLNRNLFYLAKPFIPRSLQLLARRQMARHKLARHADVWPINQEACRKPEGWPGWPGGKRFCLVLSHDVDTQRGHDDALKLLEIEERLGFRSSFNFVAEKYRVSIDLIREIQRRGFGVCVHGLKHDGLLFLNKGIFAARARRINKYLAYWGTRGFTAPSMIRNLEWMHGLDIDYATTTFDTDPFEPQPDGVDTLFPFWVRSRETGRAYLEMPYTLPQDFTLFVILKTGGIDLWKDKLAHVAGHGAMALLNTHPDYMNFNGRRNGREEYPARYYREFLAFVKERYAGEFWNPLAAEVPGFLRAESMGPEVGVREGGRPRPLEVGGRPAAATAVAARSGGVPHAPMNVCMLAYTFYETDNRVKRYAETMARRGDRVTVVSLRQPGQGAYGEQKGVRVHRIQERVLNERGKLTYLSRLLKFFFRSMAFVTREHLRRPLDVIHVHSVPDFEVFAALVPKLLGARVILDIHDIVPEFYQSKFKTRPEAPLIRALRWVERLSCAFADHIIISNHLWEKVLCRRSAPPSKVTTILNFPDGTLFRKIPAPERNGRKVLMYPGTINWHQGLDIAVKAFARLRDNHPEMEFHIYGDGPSRQEIAALVRELNLENRVILKGVVAIEDVPKIMAGSDIGIIPKRNDAFGGDAFSTKSLEFMTMGVPIVMSRTRIDDFYFNNAVVRFFEPGDAEDLARQLEGLLGSLEAVRRQAEAADAFVERFQWHRNQQVYLGMVERLARP